MSMDAINLPSSTKYFADEIKSWQTDWTGKQLM